MKRFKVQPWLAILAVLVMGSAVFAQVYPRIDYLGYGWTDIPVSADLGEVLSFTAVANSVDPLYEVDTGANELTIYAYGLVEQQRTYLGDGVTMVVYSGGIMDMYVDPARNADWGIDPPNGVSPGTFSDGVLFFRGSFLNFTIYYGPDGSGSFQGNLDGLGGDMIAEPCADCAYTVGGTFLPETGATIPAGYAMRVDGHFQIDEALPNQQLNWGRVKALYGD